MTAEQNFKKNSRQKHAIRITFNMDKFAYTKEMF